MKINFGDFSNFGKAIKVLRPTKFKVLRQTSLYKYFGTNQPFEESSDEEETEFIVEDEPVYPEDDNSTILGKNLFEEESESKDNNSINSYISTQEDELDFTNEDGTFNIDKFNQWNDCPICDDNSFKNACPNFAAV